METGINNNDINKVTDNKDGTEQLNGVQVQPFNKLSDTIGGRNLLINTAQLNDSTVCLDRKSNISDTYLGLNIYQTNTQWDGMKIFWSYLAPKLKTNTNYIMSEYVRNTSPTTSASIGIYGTDSGVVLNSNNGPSSLIKLPPNSGWTRISALVNIASFPTEVNGRLRFENSTTLTDGYVQFAGLKFEQGSVATDWTPAPEDKVNIADMRKAASDVVGLEDITQTVLPNGTDFYTLLNTTGRPLHYSVPTYVQAQSMINKPTSGLSAFILTTSSVGDNTTTAYNYTFLNLRDDSTGDSYEAFIVTGGDGKITVARPWHKMADDSKVAHLSGANNFDTVPTYGTNNKPFAINDTGATTARPTGQAVGYQYFDTTLNKPIWYNGTNWVDSTGTTV